MLVDIVPLVINYPQGLPGYCTVFCYCCQFIFIHGVIKPTELRSVYVQISQGYDYKTTHHINKWMCCSKSAWLLQLIGNETPPAGRDRSGVARA